MFKIEGNSILITRGDTGIFSLTVRDSNGAVYDYSDDAVRLTVRRNVYAKEPVLQKTIVYGESVAITSSDTASLPYGEYVYDVELKTPSGMVCTIIPPSRFVIMVEVTY